MLIMLFCTRCDSRKFKGFVEEYESLDIKNKDNVHKILMDFCRKYEELCIVKYPDAPLPLEILKSIN